MDRRQAENLVFRLSSPTFRRENADGTRTVIVGRQEERVLEALDDAALRAMMPAHYAVLFRGETA